MPEYTNTSGCTFERPGDGPDALGWTAGPGDTVEADENPVPGCFADAADSPPADSPPADQTPAPPADPGQPGE
jgi:hypothetical protein